jgi:atypical dual specificity phosphatase
MGSLPLKWDVEEIVRDHNVGAVVNMTIEWSGPTEHYERHGVKQLRLPTVDTAAPTLEQVHEGVAFIEEFLAANPGKRVFIHCKGGRGRAAVMTACFYISRRKGKADPHEVVRELKQKRHVVSTAVAHYEVVQEFHAHIVRIHAGTDGSDGNGAARSRKGRGKAKAT